MRTAIPNLSSIVPISSGCNPCIINESTPAFSFAVPIDNPYYSPYEQYAFQIRGVEGDAVPLNCAYKGLGDVNPDYKVCEYPSFWLSMNPRHVGDEVELYTSLDQRGVDKLY